MPSQRKFLCKEILPFLWSCKYDTGNWCHTKTIPFSQIFNQVYDISGYGQENNLNTMEIIRRTTSSIFSLYNHKVKALGVDNISSVICEITIDQDGNILPFSHLFDLWEFSTKDLIWSMYGWVQNWQIRIPVCGFSWLDPEMLFSGMVKPCLRGEGQKW